MREKLKYGIKEFLLYTTSMVVILLVMWLMIWITKELSYKYIYEAKVKQTIIEMVNSEYLKDQVK